MGGGDVGYLMNLAGLAWELGGLVFFARRLEQRASINGIVGIEGKTQGSELSDPCPSFV